MKNTVTYNAVQVILVKIVGGFVYFPVWWYGEGLLSVLKWVWRRLRQIDRSLSLVLWLKNMFVPMYGQYNIAGRIISFFMRLIVLFYRLVIFIVNFVFLMTIVIFYLGVLPGVVYMLI